MSSETIDVIDQLTKNLNNHAIKKLGPGTGNGITENGNSKKNGASTVPVAKRHFEPAKIVTSSKRPRPEGEENHGDERTKLRKNDKETGSNNTHKKLSFFHSDDEGDESSNGDSSSPKPPPVSSKCETKNNPKVIAHENKDSPNYGPKDELEKGNEEDSTSTTSSCSCEEHSSVASGVLVDPHEDLDFEEDSITGSPPTERSPSDSKQSQNLNSTSPSRVNLESSKNEAEIITIDLEDSSDVHQADNSKVLSEGEAEDSDDDMSEKSTKHKDRIKSFINLDRYHDSDHNSPDRKDKSTKSYRSLLRYFFKDTCYFQIKSINHENVELSKSMGVWSTSIQNELRLNSAFREHRNVILIFSVQQSGAFQGFARMISEARPSSRPIPWILPERLSNKSLGGVMNLEWLCTKELQFHETLDLFNPFNENKPVKIARDGQQVEPRIGKKLCKLFPEDDKDRLLDCLSTLKHQTSQRRKTSIRYDNHHYPFSDQPDFGVVPYNNERYRHDYGPNQPPHFMAPNEFFTGDYLTDADIFRMRNGGGRERAFDLHPNQGIYHRQTPNHYHGQFRHHYPMQPQRRFPNGLPARYMTPYCESEPHPGLDGLADNDTHQQIGPQFLWSHPNSPRNRPYQRSRR